MMIIGTLKRLWKFILNLSASLPSGISPELLSTGELYHGKFDRYAAIETNETSEQSDDRLGEPMGTGEKKRNV